MENLDEINECVKDLQAEIASLNQQTAGSEEEKEALKDLRDGFLEGARLVQSRLDLYNDRRWR